MKHTELRINLRDGIRYTFYEYDDLPGNSTEPDIEALAEWESHCEEMLAELHERNLARDIKDRRIIRPRRFSA